MKTPGITADTALPSRFGEWGHYPQVRADTAVSMPGPDHLPLLFLTLCGTYARRPRDGDTVELAVCVRCAEIRERQRADQPCSPA